MGLFDNLKQKNMSARERAVTLISKETKEFGNLRGMTRNGLFDSGGANKIVKSMHESELSRILSLPVIRPLNEEEIEDYSRQMIFAEHFDKGFRLLARQAEAVMSYELWQRAFCPIGVGEGKTGISLMIPEKAYARGINKMVLIIPPSLIEQLVNVDIPFWRRHTSISYPIHVLAGRTPKARKAMVSSGRRGLYIMTYSILSTSDTEMMFNEIEPELILCDEAQELGNRASARARRMKKVFEDFTPQLVPMSGTITNKTVMDYYTLAKEALGHSCFLPIDPTSAVDWGARLDAEITKGDIDTRKWNSGVLEPLVTWAKEYREREVAEAIVDMKVPFTAGDFLIERCCDDIVKQNNSVLEKLEKCLHCKTPVIKKEMLSPELPPGVAGFRRAFAFRMRTCPGVVSSPKNTIKTALSFDNWDISLEEKYSYDSWDRIRELVDGVVCQNLTPNGDEIKHAMHAWKWLYQLHGGGFYTELIWPEVDFLADRRRISVADATEYLERGRDFHAGAQAYNAFLRTFLEDTHIPGLDTPFLVGQDMYRNQDTNVPRALYEVWKDHKDLDFPERKQFLRQVPRTDDFGRLRNAIRVCPFKIDAMVRWCKKMYLEDKKHGGLIWVHHQEMGDWAYEALKKANLPVLHCPAGKEFDTKIRNTRYRNHWVVASLNSHGTGKNLQHFYRNYFLEWPRSAALAEQSVGRTHRTGQTADRLTMFTCKTSEFDDMTFAATLNDALYIHQTSAAQRLIIADYKKPPAIYPCEVLHERGLKPTILTRDQKESLAEMFGQTT